MVIALKNLTKFLWNCTSFCTKNIVGDWLVSERVTLSSLKMAVRRRNSSLGCKDHQSTNHTGGRLKQNWHSHIYWSPQPEHRWLSVTSQFNLTEGGRDGGHGHNLNNILPHSHFLLLLHGGKHLEIQISQLNMWCLMHSQSKKKNEKKKTY